jgi:uncharacterized MAPEG superfamily protein
MNDLHFLAASAVLAWIQIMTASTLRSRSWTWTGLRYALSNRDAGPPPTAVAERADRAAKNMIENLVLFTALLVAARGLGGAPSRLVLGAQIFFWARLAYFPVYVAGISALRSAIWVVSLLGFVVLLASAFA